MFKLFCRHDWVLHDQRWFEANGNIVRECVKCQAVHVFAGSSKGYLVDWVKVPPSVVQLAQRRKLRVVFYYQDLDFKEINE